MGTRDTACIHTCAGKQYVAHANSHPLWADLRDETRGMKTTQNKISAFDDYGQNKFTTEMQLDKAQGYQNTCRYVTMLRPCPADRQTEEQTLTHTNQRTDRETEMQVNTQTGGRDTMRQMLSWDIRLKYSKNQPTSQPTSQPASEPASEPASQPVSQPASQ